MAERQAADTRPTLTRAGQTYDEHREQQLGHAPWLGCMCGEAFEHDVDRANHIGAEIVRANAEAAGSFNAYSDPLTGPAEDANRLQAVREVADRRHLYTDLGHYADAVDQALDGPTTQGDDA